MLHTIALDTAQTFVYQMIPSTPSGKIGLKTLLESPDILPVLAAGEEVPTPQELVLRFFDQQERQHSGPSSRDLMPPPPNPFGGLPSFDSFRRRSLPQFQLKPEILDIIEEEVKKVAIQFSVYQIL